jgi:hypothetical protein
MKRFAWLSAIVVLVSFRPVEVWASMISAALLPFSG